jgi:hypothetical protein
MSKGLKLPMGVDNTGGAAMVSGEENDRKTIFSALSDCENQHAFQQDVGLGNAMVFNINDGRIRAKIQRKVEAIFRQFRAENRFKLDIGSIKWTAKTDTGELMLALKYVDLETEETKSFQRVFTTSGAGAES